MQMETITEDEASMTVGPATATLSQMNNRSTFKIQTKSELWRSVWSKSYPKKWCLNADGDNYGG